MTLHRLHCRHPSGFLRPCAETGSEAAMMAYAALLNRYAREGFLFTVRVEVEEQRESFLEMGRIGYGTQ